MGQERPSPPEPADTADRPSMGISLFLGVGTIVAGLTLVFWPGVTLLVLSQIAGWSMGVVGLLGAIDEVMKGRARSWQFLRSLLVGIIGVALILWPDRTLLVATVLAGVWLIVDGGSRLMESMYSSSKRQEVIGLALGFGEAVVGVLVIARPVGGVTASSVFVGIGLAVHGGSRIWRAVSSRWTSPEVGIEPAA